jgi:hypothetical protein
MQQMELATIKDGKYFISHSYNDLPLRDKIISRLRPGIEPYIFPPIITSPLEFVSNTLIGALLACDGLIFPDGSESRESFWVTFEREYSVHIGKTVIAYEILADRFNKYQLPPLELRLFFSAAIEDYPRLDPIIKFMAEKRFFRILLPHDELQRRASRDPIRVSLADALRGLNKEGQALIRQDLRSLWSYSDIKSLMSEFLFTRDHQGYLIVFWSKNSLTSEFQADDLLIAREIQAGAEAQWRLDSKRWNEDRYPGYNLINLSFKNIMKSEADRILFVLLDRTPLPKWAVHYVQLFGDETRSEVNRIDDVIVRTYWLIYNYANSTKSLDDSFDDS